MRAGLRYVQFAPLLKAALVRAFFFTPIRQCGLVTTGGRGGSGLASGRAWLRHIERQHGTWSCDWSYLSATDPAETLSRRYHRHLDRHIRWNAPHPCLRPLPSRHHPGTFTCRFCLDQHNVHVQSCGAGLRTELGPGSRPRHLPDGFFCRHVTRQRRMGTCCDTRYDKCLTCRGRRWSVRYAADDTPVARAAR